MDISVYPKLSALQLYHLSPSPGWLWWGLQTRTARQTKFCKCTHLACKVVQAIHMLHASLNHYNSWEDFAWKSGTWACETFKSKKSRLTEIGLEQDQHWLAEGHILVLGGYLEHNSRLELSAGLDLKLQNHLCYCHKPMSKIHYVIT